MGELTLPVEGVLPALLDAVRTAPAVVLSAAPGAGKTTRVPLALLADGVIAGRMVMLEPRRLAAVRAAQYMAAQLGEKVGETVGYRIRGESRISERTRIEVVTEGVLTRLIQDDPELTGIGLLIFDEFHERSLQADLGLALAVEVQRLWQPDLRLLVMSATLDVEAVSGLLGGAPVISSEGRSYPVDTVHVARDSRQLMESQLVDLILRALREQQGDVLVFLPGQREIRRVQTLLQGRLPDDRGAEGVALQLLYGEATSAQQQAALTPDAGGRRKLILSTAIAETSLTIDGVRVVVDAGLVRTARFDARRGMSGLVTLPVSQATAEQRRGRAGRQQPGACYRLWSADQHAALARFPEPEMVHSDLAPLALELAVWGTPEQELAFLDPPPVAHLAQARSLLVQLGALDAEGRLTAHGRAMAALPVHPRFAHMLLRAREIGCAALACDIAALLEARDLLRGRDNDVDLHARWLALRHGGAGDSAAREQARAQARRLRALLGCAAETAGEDEDRIGLMIALCYPERVARKRDAGGERWQMASGVGASLATGSVLARNEWLAVADVDGEGRDVRIYLAAEVTIEDLLQHLPELVFAGEEVQWSVRDEAVVAREVRRFGQIVIDEKKLAVPPARMAAALCEGLQRIGCAAWPWPDAARDFLARLRWLQRQPFAVALFSEASIADFSDESLARQVSVWLAPFLSGISRRSQFGQIDWLAALQAIFPYAALQEIDRLAPVSLPVPTGSRIRLDYSGEQPVLAVRLQEMFGEQQTPRIAGGSVPVLLHLLSPRQQPLAVTQDLASFWLNAYPQVRKDMRGQYPKHYWPENPLEAEPTRRSKAADDRQRKREEKR